MPTQSRCSVARTARSLFIATILAGALGHPCFAAPQTAPGIIEVMKRVNTYTREHPYQATDRNWIRATYYTGVMGAYHATGDEAYLEQATAWAEKHQWRPGTSERPGGNILTSAQVYLQLYFLDKDERKIQPTIDWLESGRPNTPTGAEAWYLEGITVRRYADSLYVGPPALAMLARATGDQKYLDWLHRFFWDVYTELFDQDVGLFYRDKRYIDARSPHGRPVFWSRGNGWAIAGLARIMEYLPEDDPLFPRYKTLFRTMARAVVDRQGPDGLWRSNLGDPDHYTMPESSGTAFFVYALAWGMNHGVLAPEEYLPATLRGWNGLVRSVHPNGKLGWVQPVDAEPRPSLPVTTHEYAAGLFLLAGSELLGLVRSSLTSEAELAAQRLEDDSFLPPRALVEGDLDPSLHPYAPRIDTFLRRQAQVTDFVPTGLERSDYLDVIAGQVRAMRGYQDESGRIIDPVLEREMYYSTPCYAHAVAVLVASGHVTDASTMQSGMLALDIALADLAGNRAAGDHGDFFTWPLMFAYELFLPFASEQRRAHWDQLFGAIDSEKAYRHYRRPYEAHEYQAFYDNYGPNYADNWNIVNAAGEFLRSLHGHTDLGYVDASLAMQLPHFTREGMYDEYGDPLPYDLFTRYYVTGMLHRGYRSFPFTTYREIIWKGAWTSLFMQSPYGELPAGYRSAQHIWNEAEEAVVFEIYATHYAAAGRLREAGAFKRAARLALASVQEWIRPDGSGYVVKNRYPIEARHGYEPYTMHTCYNLLACSMLAQAWQHADDRIEEKPCPADVGGFVIETPVFHKVFANAGGNYVEYDTNARHVYNPMGILRIHLRDGHPQLGPSNGTATGGPNYDEGAEVNLAVGPAWRSSDGTWTKLADVEGVIPTVEVLEESPSRASFRVTYVIEAPPVAGDPVVVTETVTVKADGVFVVDRVRGKDVETLRIYYPMLVFDGQEHTDVQLSERSVRLHLRGRGVRFDT